MKIVEELERLLAESEAENDCPTPWSEDESSRDVVDANGVAVASYIPRRDTRLIVAMRNALPALLEVVKAAEVLTTNQPGSYVQDGMRLVNALASLRSRSHT